jgi:hypothetical protein
MFMVLNVLWENVTADRSGRIGYLDRQFFFSKFRSNSNKLSKKFKNFKMITENNQNI